MTSARAFDLENDRIHSAITELTTAISLAYPGTACIVSHPDDEPNSVEVTAIVDVDDPDEVLDLVIDRVIDLQVDENIPIHVVPVRTPERVSAERAERHRAGRRS